MVPGQLNEFYAELVAKKSRETIQRDLLDKAEQTDLELDITGESTKTLTVDAVLRARMKWGEQANASVPALFCHSAQYSALAQTSDFRTVASTFRDSIAASNINNPGPVAVVHGVQIWLCDSVTKAGSDYTALMLMPGALGLYMKEATAGEPIRHAGSRVVTLDYHFRWASTLFRNAPRGAVKLITE